MSGDTPAARIRAYLDALPNTVSLGAEFAYGKQFRSEGWPHDSYPLTREDVEAVLDAAEDAEVMRNAPILRHCLYPGCLREYDAGAGLAGHPVRPAWSSAGWHQIRPTVATGNVCPDHFATVSQHHPRWEIRDESADSVAVLHCLCGWESPAARWQGYAVAAWQNHLVEVEAS